MRSLSLLAAVMGLAVLLTTGMPAGAATRTPIDYEFTMADMCSFPVVVHWQGFALVTGNVTHQHATVTITNRATGRSVSETVQETDHLQTWKDGSSVDRTTGSWKIVRQGSGLVWADTGQQAWWYDRDHNLVATKLVGSHDPYTAYLDAICGQLR